jgi:hypothetical protein
MKSLQEFEQFIAADPDLNASLINVEKQRKNTKSSVVTILLISLVLVIGMAYFMYSKTKDTSSNAGTSNIIYIILIMIGVGYAISYFYMLIIKNKIKADATMFGEGSGDFRFNFKDRIVRKLVAFWDPSFKYQINNHIKAAEVLESGMLYPKNYKAGGSDMIQGEINGVTFRFSDLHLLLEKKYVQKNEDPYETIMFGSFFVADFQKQFKNPVFVYPNKSFFADSIGYLRYEGEKVLLEDPEFSKKFEVYATDQIEARYILTTSMMERIKSMSLKMGNNLHIAFANNRVYVMNNNSKDRFEASWFKQVDKKETLIQFYNELTEQLSIIDDLKLNVHIWN